MRTEPSDILKLLKLLGDEQGDWTCRQLHDLAVRDGLPILDVCHEAIRILAAEKKGATDRLTEIVALTLPKPMVVSDDDAARLGVQLPSK